MKLPVKSAANNQQAFMLRLPVFFACELLVSIELNVIAIFSGCVTNEGCWA
ncbi:hypothetical protein AALB_1886 [Agarivorans albus MKT 106]|uniref:Uncharacterized protein n=1 Tax=Agarivorans albus MKT 106 TaxID=1331007 RepID=R9PT50_AGAAL|nr:hypothetical protein AALB_1886 [Agarivorans albus MKT 106]